MYKKFTAALMLVAVLAVAAPDGARAAGLTDAQIQAIVSLVSSFGADAGIVKNIESVLRGTVGGGAIPPAVGIGIAKPGVVGGNEWRHAVCGRVFSRAFTLGDQGEEVKEIQSFLKQEGLFDREPTGFFGTLTAQALGHWQVQNSVVVSDDGSETALVNRGFGIFGPKTREYIKAWCDRGHDKFIAEPQRGSAPLTVVFSAWVGGFTPFQYWIDFGDGSAREQIACSAPADACVSPGKVKHIYAQDGTYTAALYRTSTFTASGDITVSTSDEIIGKKLIQVGAVVQGCTKEFRPVCGQPNGCKISPNGTEMCAQPDPRTFANECMMKQEGATFLYEGQCTQGTKPFEPAPSCKSWYDGCNDCSRSTPGGPAACTLRACIWNAPGYCKEKFDDVVGNKPPVISGFSGPTVLSVGTLGTWEVKASDPENGSLSYRVRWGDEHVYDTRAAVSIAAEAAFMQTSTFTHSYATAGVYTITVVVEDSTGQQAKTSTTVKVGSDGVACTLQYDPVCGQPPEPACRKTPPYCMLPTPGPQTYSNTCFLGAAGATLLYRGECKTEPVACTADAKQCSDGSWVGRTGPHCEFVCPSSTSNQ